MGFDIVSYAMGKAAGGGGGGGGDPALPPEYQRVEYLANDGNCWCSINASIKKLDVLEIEVSLASDASSGENGICGSEQGTWEIYASNNKIQAWGSSLESVELSIQRDVKATYATMFSSGGAGAATSFLWGRYKTNSYPFKGKMYALRIYRGFGSAEEKFVNLVPCYRKADSVPGFYDLSNSAFYINAGSGTFTPGPDV